MTEAVSKRQVGGIDVEGISRWITGLFPAQPFPAAFIGLGLAGLPLTGGALTKDATKDILGEGLVGTLAVLSS